MTLRWRDSRSRAAVPSPAAGPAAALLAALTALALPVAALTTPAAAQEADAGREAGAAPAAGDGAEAGDASRDVAILIHGGAGSMREVNMPEEEARAHRSAMAEALRAGRSVLEEGGSSVSACVAAIQVMEASPLFNAGVGAVLTSEGTVEHDASIMDGRTRNSGAVAGVQHVRSPIALARLVMDSSDHVMFAREGAEAFAEEHGIEMVPNETFYTEERKAQWERRNRREEDGGGARAASAGAGVRGPGTGHLGTVGCAALDRDGDLAAGTSTGGISNKRWGRVGDSPVIGAGTYADNETAAISATGAGEYFIRGVVAHDIASMMRYTGLDLAPAVAAVIHGRLEQLGPEATGGVIAMDREGDIAVSFNTPGMYRGWIGTDGEMEIRIYRR